MNAPEDQIFAKGLTINFFIDELLENDHHEKNHNLPYYLLRWRQMGDWEKLQQVLNFKNFKFLIWNNDPNVRYSFQKNFQLGLDTVFLQLNEAVNSGCWDVLKQNQAELYIKNCLSFFPYTEPSPGSIVHIPQFVEGAWQKIPYQVSLIELTPTEGVFKLFIEEQDRFFAFGLETQDARAKSILVFMATAYPAAQGFLTTFEANLKPFSTPGEQIYKSAHQQLSIWIDSQIEKYGQKVDVCGLSLGGTLALLAAIHLGDKIHRVDAHNPPGLYSSSLKNKTIDRWETLSEKPKVYIQKQLGDFISSHGFWKPEWTILQVVPKDEGGTRKFGQVEKHTMNYMGLEGTQIIKICPIKDNQARVQRSFYSYGLFRASLYFFLWGPYRYFLVTPTRLIVKPQYMSFISSNLAWAAPPYFALSYSTGLVLSLISSAYVLWAVWKEPDTLWGKIKRVAFTATGAGTVVLALGRVMGLSLPVKIAITMLAISSFMLLKKEMNAQGIFANLTKVPREPSLDVETPVEN